MHAGVPLISTGLASIYYYLKDAKINTEIIIIDPETIANIFLQLERLQYLKLIGISMHWHPQIAVSIKLAELIKLLPNCQKIPIVFGGISASYFADELIKIPFVDYVIKGDGELPMLLLFNQICKKEFAPSSIPNLYYKKDGEYLKSKRDYRIDDKTITSLEAKVLTNRKLFGKAMFALSVGRGCNQYCIYCGGNRYALAKWGNRTKALQREIKNFKKSIRKALKEKNHYLYILNDYDGKCKFIGKCLKDFNLSTLKELGIDSWGLPDFKNIKQVLKNTPEKKDFLLTIEICPEVGDEKIRKKIKSFSFSNKELNDFLTDFFSHCQNQGAIALFFSFFHPYTEMDNHSTRQMIYSLVEKYFKYIIEGKMMIFFWPLSTDPGSSIQQNFIKELKHDLHSLNDYYCKMLSMKISQGNFLRHSLKNMKIEEIDYYCSFFNFEEILRSSYPLLYLNIVKLFSNFKGYTSFLKESFNIMYETYIKPSLTSSFYGQIINDSTINMLGFYYIMDQIPPRGKFKIIWLQIVKWNLLKNKQRYLKNYSKIKRKGYFSAEFINLPSSDKFGAFTSCKKTVLKYEDLYQYTMELLNTIIRYEIFRLAETKSQRPHYWEIMLKNHLKIAAIKENEFSNLVPVKSTVCEISELSFMQLKIKPLDIKDNLKILGKDLLEQIISTINYQALPKNLVLKLKRYLKCYGNLKNVMLRSVGEFWKVISSPEKSQSHALFTELIITGYVPTKEILEYLGLYLGKTGEKKYFLKKNIQILSSLSLSGLYGVFSDICDIRAVIFYINYLKYFYHINQIISANGKKIINFVTCFYPDSESYAKPFVLSGALDNLELEAIKLADGSHSIPEIFSRLIDKVKKREIAVCYIKDMIISLYARQLIY
jgi:hypothetical protein